MMPTPKNHLPKGYPLPAPEEWKTYKSVFDRAFKIHETAHDFNKNEVVKTKDGWVEFAPRPGILSPIRGRTKLSKAHYCDCYERAYQESVHNVNNGALVA